MCCGFLRGRCSPVFYYLQFTMTGFFAGGFYSILCRFIKGFSEIWMLVNHENAEEWLLESVEFSGSNHFALLFLFRSISEGNNLDRSLDME